MERYNKKKKLISIERAKDNIMHFWQKLTADGSRYVWLGDKVEEYRGGYLIPAAPIKTGKEKPDSYIRAWVDYATGEVFMGFDVTA